MRPPAVLSRLPLASNDLEDGVRYCRDLTRREARNFYWGFLALPREQRGAIYALYSFARQIDDAVDVNETSDDGFALQRERLDECFARPHGQTERQGDPVMKVLRHVVGEYDIPRGELEALIEGVEMDLQVSRYASWEELRPYCHRVASTVGRMCVRIFSFDDESALERADELGLAMQLANILRDVREDAQHGRVYLPIEELNRFNVTAERLATGDPEPGWEPLVRLQATRAHQYFDSGLKVTQMIPRRAAACVLTMAGMYQQILAEIENDPYLPFRRRASLRKRTKLIVMARSWLQAM